MTTQAEKDSAVAAAHASIDKLASMIVVGGSVPPVPIPPEVEVPPVVVVPPAGGKNLNMAILDARPGAGTPWVIGPKANRHLMTAEYGHMMANDVVIVKIRTPSNLGSGAASGSLGYTEISSDPIQNRMLVLSETPGDFDHPLDGHPNAKIPSAQNGSMVFMVGPNLGYDAPNLSKPDHDYYINIRNVGPVPSPTGTYDLDLEWRNPK